MSHQYEDDVVNQDLALSEESSAEENSPHSSKVDDKNRDLDEESFSEMIPPTMRYQSLRENAGIRLETALTNGLNRAS